VEIVRDIPKLKARPVDGHKGLFGKVCIVAGSVGMTGAAVLAGRAALRSGSGLVRVATAKSALPIVAAHEACFTTIPLAEDSAGRINAKAIHAILNATEGNDITAFGPGVGVTNGARQILETVLQKEGLRLLIDADGLTNLSRINGWPAKVKAKVVLTPHPGEMKRLWQGTFREPLPEDRRDQATRVAQAARAVVVLKGTGTVVTDGHRVYINTTGNPGMSTGGTGDCLTGIVAALMGQGLDNFDAAVLGVHVHGLAGDIAAERLGQVSLIAMDVIDALPEAFKRNSI
jgi:ADP-dependent NAD(P)H-hydrate dehydratase